MPMLADLVDAVIGADTHTDTHTAAVVDRLGAHLATLQVSADAGGYTQQVKFAARHAPGPGIAWAAGAAVPTAPAWPPRSPPPGTQ